MILCYINFTAIFKAIEERLYFLINKKHSNSFNYKEEKLEKKTRNEKKGKTEDRRERRKIKPQRGMKKKQTDHKENKACSHFWEMPAPFLCPSLSGSEGVGGGAVLPCLALS